MRKVISVLLACCLFGLAVAPYAMAQESESLTLSCVPDVGRFGDRAPEIVSMDGLPAALADAEQNGLLY